jgi:hypothetical protein
MSTSTHVQGLVPHDDKWRMMKDVWFACEAADVDIPDDVIDFFDGQPPDENGQPIDIKRGVVEYTRDGQQGFDVHLDQLPVNVKVIRFFNSYRGGAKPCGECASCTQ